MSSVKQIFTSMREKLENHYAYTAKEYLNTPYLLNGLWEANDRGDINRQVMKRLRLKHFGSTNEQLRKEWLP